MTRLLANPGMATRRLSRAIDRLAVRRSLLGLILTLWASGDAGTGILHAGIIEPGTTGAPNNDDYVGSFADNPNRYFIETRDSGSLVFDRIVPVVNSGRTTEYAVTLSGSYDRDVDGPLERPYRLQLGFGVGSHFIPASSVVPGLDFDFPAPSNPALDPTIKLFGLITLFTLRGQSGDTIDLQGGGGGSRIISFSTRSLFRVPVDVPDLPDTVLSLYAPGDLPADFPAGALPFTIQGTFVPEPSTYSLTLVGALSLGAVAWWRRQRTA